ncbi:MAG: sterol desaturase family protein [Hyphomicrobiales bacterium]|nr:sterol desaturase family protein [Hyphomicrobiales bacterium]
MKLSKALYFGDFVATPLAALVLAIWALAGRGYLGAGLWALAFLIGIGAWTLVEYAVHRWLYHRVPFFEKFHDAHHADPDGLIGAPSFLAILVLLALFFAPLLVLGLIIASGFASGILLGYMLYMLVHHASHHVIPRPGSLLYTARIRHMAHHYHAMPGNYGVITAFWDKLFSTRLHGEGRLSRR